MTVRPVELFAFLTSQDAFHVEKVEVASPAFGRLRRSLRSIAWTFRDADDPPTLELLGELRRLLSEWLTVPVPFDALISESLEARFGTPIAVQARWGTEIRAAYEIALDAAEDLATGENPMRDALRAALADNLSQRRSLKIYCHKQARFHFASLFGDEATTCLDDSMYIHSLRQYCETSPFDVLVKVGPLRARGWGSAPDALKNAPRFKTLAQFVWQGTNDDADFGFDPVGAFETTRGAESDDSRTGEVKKSNSFVPWKVRTSRVGDNPAADHDGRGIDDLQFFHQIYETRDTRAATMVQIGEKEAVLYPPFSNLLSFDPDPGSPEPVDLRVPGETLNEGMFLILPELIDAGIGGATAKDGSYGRAWKARLREEFSRDPHDLIARLRNANLGIKHLRQAIEHWCEAPTTVVHAPQRIVHFEILCRVLGLEHGVTASNSRDPMQWWQMAWREIRKSRGEAIQTGFLEKEIIRVRVLQVLRSLLSEIRTKCAENSDFFRIETPPAADLGGEFAFCRVASVEQGFHVPEAELKVIHEIEVVDQWRD